ncbi:SpoIIE family protein phosphatase [Streptomyces actuosus]|uniref:SpoIIE family protein phosphatase n=1 Tax=Streptomyces actuosus TaxID=1885 RepID=A0ABS2VWJ5_STRAS|nr:SpoIIE family protein phosphatase [Streptomyces actuosus]MBN0047497.1 SpoIIE family protein phosphatase [Streptomyces actuosus]
MGAFEEQNAVHRRFDVAHAAPLLLDERGVVAAWTGDAGRLLGYGAAEAVGLAFAGLLVDTDAERFPELVGRCRSDGGWAGLLTARRRDGGALRVMARITPALEGGGPARCLVLLSETGGAPGWAMSRPVLEQMVAGSPVGIAVVDTDLRYVWSNEALTRFGGGSPDQRLGRRLRDVQPGLDAEGIEAQMRRVLASGEPVVGYEHLGRVRSAPRRETAHMMSFTRLDDDHGRPMGVYYTVADVTDRYRARCRLALLDRAGEQLGRTLDVTRTAQELAEVAVPAFADFVAVDLLDCVLRGAEASGPAETVPLRRAGQQSVHPEVPEAMVGVGEVASYLPDSPPVRALVSGRSWRKERLEPRDRRWATHLPVGREATFLQLGLHSVMIVPIRARGVTLGVATFFRRRRQEPFDEEDLDLAEDLVARAAVCMDNARRYTRERDAALVLQRNLLPHRLPELEAVEAAACYRPADELIGLGGDWYDLIPLSGARVALVVGEVPGHGIGAAAAMGRLRTAVRTLAALDLPPEEVLAHLDDLVSSTAWEEGMRPDAEGADAQAVGSCCVYVVYDPVDGRCSMAAAGHPAPALIGPDGAVTFVELPQGPTLGAGGPPFESVELDLVEGSTLALHTDGLLARGEQWAVDADRERLGRALGRRADSLEQRCRAVVEGLVPSRPHDDVALLMARTRRLGAHQVATWELAHDPAVVADARRTAVRQLAEWGLDELASTTELVVSELVTNAVRYTGGPIRLRLIRERSLVCEVFDAGATAPHLRHPRANDEGGRGLLLVSQFTQRWGTRFVPDGKILWAEQALTDAGP